MVFELVGRVLFPTANTDCYEGELRVWSAKEVWFVWAGGTEYAMETQDWNFRGEDPHEFLISTLNTLNAIPYATYRSDHINDILSVVGDFNLDLGQSMDWTRSTDELLSYYRQDDAENGALLEWLLFFFGRYLVISSARGHVPANLQGIWSKDWYAPWNGGEFVYFVSAHFPDIICRLSWCVLIQ